MPTIATINGIAEDNIATHNGGTASLYTSKNGDTWVHFVGMVATGGSIATDGDYKVHTFNSNATFEVTTEGHGEVEYLVIGGGGGGDVCSGHVQYRLRGQLDQCGGHERFSRPLRTATPK